MSPRRPKVTNTQLRETMRTAEELGLVVRAWKLDPATGCVEIVFGKPEPTDSLDADLDKLEDRFG